jgi:hypothetical protein
MLGECHSGQCDPPVTGDARPGSDVGRPQQVAEGDRIGLTCERPIRTAVESLRIRDRLSELGVHETASS